MFRRYGRLFMIFLRYQLLRDLQFKSSFMLRVFANLVEFGFMLTFFSVIYRNNLIVPGWTLEQTFVLLATYQLVNSLFALFFSGVSSLSYLVEQGELDGLLVKPVDAQFVLSCRRFSFDALFPLGGGLVLLIWSGAKLALVPGAAQIFSYCLLVINGVLLKYALAFLLMSLSLRVIRIDALYALFLDFFTLSQYPAGIFKGLSRILFRTAIPVIVVANIPAGVLFDGFSWQAASLGVTVMLVFLVAGRLAWLASLKNYVGASS